MYIYLYIYIYSENGVLASDYVRELLNLSLYIQATTVIETNNDATPSTGTWSNHRRLVKLPQSILQILRLPPRHVIYDCPELLEIIQNT